MSTYNITLTPMGSFFFGGDMRFQVSDKEDEFTSYIIESRKFPQQTSLLGMLRFLILSNNEAAFSMPEQSIKDSKLAKELIGESSFKYSDSGSKNRFGRINSIGPCGLRKDNGETLFPVFKFVNSYDEDGLPGFRDVNRDCKGYKAKLGLATTFGGFGGDEIFKKDKRMGINRDITTGKTEEGALYKQIFYRLEDGYKFSFEAEIEDCPDITTYNNQIVSIGGDNSQFLIGIEKITAQKTNDEITAHSSSVVLLSDSYISMEVAKTANFAISDIVSFICLQTSIDKTVGKEGSFDRGSGKGDKYTRSKKLYLYKAGSVFYFDKAETLQAFVKEIDSHEDFRQIGYNHYKTI